MSEMKELIDDLTSLENYLDSLPDGGLVELRGELPQIRRIVKEARNRLDTTHLRMVAAEEVAARRLGLLAQKREELAARDEAHKQAVGVAVAEARRLAEEEASRCRLRLATVRATLREALRRLLDTHPRLGNERVCQDLAKVGELLNGAILAVEMGGNPQDVSDGYHTFRELYEHRHALWIALCAVAPIDLIADVWRSRRHSDGELAFGGGWFVLGMNYTEGYQITYHLPESLWNACHFAEELEKAPPFDGHTSADVLKRLRGLVPPAEESQECQACGGTPVEFPFVCPACQGGPPA